MTTGSTGGFDRHDAFTPTADGYALTTTAFEVQAVPTETGVSVSVQVPTLAAATADTVGEIVADDWRRTLHRRLQDAPGAIPSRPSLDEFVVTRTDDHLEIVYQLSPGGADIAKAVAEYVEGTYVETTIPGYEYQPPVSTLLSSARASGQANDSEAGGR
jgi:hypothetical protein